MAQTLSFLQNALNAIYCEKGKRPKQTTVMDFMPKWGEKMEDKQIDTSEIVTLGDQIKAAFASIKDDFDRQGEKEKTFDVKKPPPAIRNKPGKKI